jgi:hypothetical protein
MSETLKFGNGQWATKVGSTLAYNDEGGNFKPLPFNFTRSTGGTRVNKDGLIEVITNNKPRIDFLNDSNGALLLEPSRTNLVTYSEDFSQWQQNGVTTTPNSAISPDGTLNADKITATTVDPYPFIFANVTATEHTFSFYYKGEADSIGKEARVLFWFIGTATGADLSVPFTLTGGWQRFESKVTPTGAGTLALRIDFPADNANIGDYGYLWGAQLEAGSYATSYIPTQGAISTKVAETCIQTPPSGIIGQTEGTLFVEVNQFGGQANSPYLLASDGTFNNRIQISSGGGGTENYFTFYISVGGVNTVFYISPTGYTGVHKLAIAYKLNDVVGYIDGVQVLNDTSSTIPATTTLEIGRSPSNPLNAGINQALLFKTRLTNAELETLTTL